MGNISRTGSDLDGLFQTNSYATKFVAGQRFFSRRRALGRYNPVAPLR